jgi:hypothetical protein
MHTNVSTSPDAQREMPTDSAVATAPISRAESAAEALLDAAVALTVPASDPVAVSDAFMAALRRERIGSD